MGLDIHIGTDKDKEVYAIDFFRNEKELRYKMSLSRNFCNLMCRQHISSGIWEFTQIGRLVGVDIVPISAMQNYWDEGSAEFQISSCDTEEERSRASQRIQSDNDRLKGNIEIVYNCITNLLDKLSTFDKLDKEIVVSGEDTIGITYYFGNFNDDKGDGFIGNNFGQDLRNFKRFLEYAKSKGATTVYFNYG